MNSLLRLSRISAGRSKLSGIDFRNSTHELGKLSIHHLNSLPINLLNQSSIAMKEKETTKSSLKEAALSARDDLNSFLDSDFLTTIRHLFNR